MPVPITINGSSVRPYVLSKPPIDARLTAADRPPLATWYIHERIANASAIIAPSAAGSSMTPDPTASTGMRTMNAVRPPSSSAVKAATRFQCATITNSMPTQIATQPPSGTSSRRIKKRPMNISQTVRECVLNASGLVGHCHGAQRQPLAGAELFGRALELAAGGEDIAAARRAHRRGVTGVEHDLGEFFDLVPVRAFVLAAGPRVERDEIDLGRNALVQTHQRLGVFQ